MIDAKVSQDSCWCLTFLTKLALKPSDTDIVNTQSVPTLHKFLYHQYVWLLITASWDFYRVRN